MRVSEIVADWRKPKPVPVPKPAKPKKPRSPDGPLFKPRKLPLPFNKPKPDDLS
jgi:hypothetical protein